MYKKPEKWFFTAWAVDGHKIITEDNYCMVAKTIANQPEQRYPIKLDIYPRGRFDYPVKYVEFKSPYKVISDLNNFAKSIMVFNAHGFGKKLRKDYEFTFGENFEYMVITEHTGSKEDKTREVIDTFDTRSVEDVNRIYKPDFLYLFLLFQEIIGKPACRGFNPERFLM